MASQTGPVMVSKGIQLASAKTTAQAALFRAGCAVLNIEQSVATWGGAFLGLLRLSWEPLDPKNIEKPMVFKVFGIAEFWLCEPLGGSLGLVLTLLGPIWSQNGPQNGPKSGQKSDQKVIQKMIPNFIKQMQILGPKMGSKM